MKRIFLILLTLSLTACSFAPEYHRPVVSIPPEYKEGNIKWVQASSKNVELNDTRWWKMYKDPVLDKLEDAATEANQNIQAAFARYQAARAELTIAKSNYYPLALGVANSYREKDSKNVANPPSTRLFSDNLLAINLTYEVDVWGRVRNLVATARSTEQASAADWAAVRLSIQAELANDYFALRGTDAAKKVLDETVIVYQKAYELTRRRYRGGISPVGDVDQAKNQLETAKTAAADLSLKRMQLEHAIATLTGRVPAELTIKPVGYHPALARVATDLPSTLLQRRPDIARAELLVQAANSNIGVAKAAFFPALNLSAAAGVESASLSNLFRSPSVVWSLGPTTAAALLNNGSMPLLTEYIFDGGKRLGITQEAYARYCEAAANYKQTVLTAYQEVEDSLSAWRQLDREQKTQTQAVIAGKKALDQAMYRYQEGLTTYLEVAVEQNIYLQSELSRVDIMTRHQIASLQLIKALGGGWRAC